MFLGSYGLLFLFIGWVWFWFDVVVRVFCVGCVSCCVGGLYVCVFFCLVIGGWGCVTFFWGFFLLRILRSVGFFVGMVLGVSLFVWVLPSALINSFNEARGPQVQAGAPNLRCHI